MALKKSIRQRDGVTTSYHRILFLQQTINRQNSIAVLSYVDEEAREAEKHSILEQPYKVSTTYETAYDEEMTIEKAYKYLKTRPEFEGAEDVYEDSVIEEESTEVKESLTGEGESIEVEDIPEEEEEPFPEESTEIEDV